MVLSSLRTGINLQSRLTGSSQAVLFNVRNEPKGQRRNLMKCRLSMTAVAVVAAFAAPATFADTCKQLAEQGLTHSSLKAQLDTVVPGNNGGLGFPMWLTLVDGSGLVCAVVNSLTDSQSATADIWLGSRIISAQKANTANAFSNNSLALSTANLYSAVQPGGSLFGLQESNPVDATVAYQGSASDFGTDEDPLVGKRIGGVNVFGGGLGIYINSKKAGAIGVSGDTSCTDHVVAWKVRSKLGVAGTPVVAFFDKMVFDITPNPNGGTGKSQSGFGHASCKGVGANITRSNDGWSVASYANY
jgi:uncharacterized protein GlcG (DUF336 family)